jgi:hypothetical protein
MQLYIIETDKSKTKLAWIVTVNENSVHWRDGKEYPRDMAYCLDANTGEVFRTFSLSEDN